MSHVKSMEITESALPCTVEPGSPRILSMVFPLTCVPSADLDLTAGWETGDTILIGMQCYLI